MCENIGGYVILTVKMCKDYIQEYLNVQFFSDIFSQSLGTHTHTHRTLFLISPIIGNSAKQKEVITI
jgi:hypothetical protein